MPVWLTWILQFVLKGFGLGSQPRQPDAEAQDKCAEAVAGEARAETMNAANAATQQAKDADRAKDDAAAAAVADGRRERMRDPESIRTSPDLHLRD